MGFCYKNYANNIWYRDMILVLGSSGLLGNALIKKLSDYNIDFVCTRRTPASSYLKQNCFIDVEDLTNNIELEKIIYNLKPSAVINCLSLSNEMRKNKNWSEYLKIYSILPRVLEMLSNKYNFKFIQISSDGVFDGNDGFYTEKDKTNATDIYGVSKILGEPSSLNSACIRTSIYGHSLDKNYGLIDWALSRNSCDGFTNYIFTGMSTLTLSDVIINVFIKKDNFGTFHVGGEPISKYELLVKMIKIYDHNCDVFKNPEPVANFSLNQDKFKNLSGKGYFNHDTMLNELYVQYT